MAALWISSGPAQENEHILQRYSPLPFLAAKLVVQGFLAWNDVVNHVVNPVLDTEKDLLGLLK